MKTKLQTKHLRKVRPVFILIIIAIVLYDFFPANKLNSYGENALTIILAVSLVIEITIEILIKKNSK